MDEDAKRNVGDRGSGPVTFHVREPGRLAAAIVMLVGLEGLSAFMVYPALALDDTGRIFFLSMAGTLALVALAVFVWLIRRWRREEEIVIDPVRGEIRVSREYEIPFSRVRQVEVVEHEYTYRGAGLEGGSFSADITGWGIDIGGGRRLFAENGLSRERVVEIADALKVRVDAYRARTGGVAAPLPRPTKKFLERLAGSLHADGETFAEEWLSLEGPMAELMREYHAEPDDHTMRRDGEFAQALRRAGFELGDAPAAETTSSSRSAKDAG